MRHFDFLTPDEQARLFMRPPQAFDLDADPQRVGVGLGATLYTPATRPRLAHDIGRRAVQGVVSLVVCLEDSVPDSQVEAAEQNAIGQLRALAAEGGPQPLIFVRVRSVEQIRLVTEGLGEYVGVLAGFVLPKFTEENGSDYLEAVVAAGEAIGRRLLAMPVLESREIGYLESRLTSLLAARRLIDKYRDHVPAVRVGATDLSGAYGLRRARDFTVWDLRVVADVICAVVNVFGRVDGGDYIVTGPVWEYFPVTERMFKPLLRESPFVAHAERALRAELIAADLDGLIREVVLDRANGLTGKTVIHPTHVAAVHALSVVTHEEYADASDVLATHGRGGAAASSFGNKMNESKPHTAWARRIMLRADAFGVAHEGFSSWISSARACTSDVWLGGGAARPAPRRRRRAVGAGRAGAARQPRRAHLLVSTVLGKHLPAHPRRVHGAGLELGRLVGKTLDGASALVLGFAETATGLGHAVAEALDAPYLHSTRRTGPGAQPYAAFEEEHSHATSHRLLPDDPALLADGEVLVLVDDELSTGRTALNTIAALHAVTPRDRYVIAALLDLRDARDRAELARVARRLGVRIEVVATAAGAIDRPEGLAERAAAAVAAATRPVEGVQRVGEVLPYLGVWPAGVRESGRHGFTPADVRAARSAAATVAATIAPACGGSVHVLGTEELMYAPTLIALELAEQGRDVRVSSTTRSPVHVVDEPGYPIRDALAFPSHDPAADGPGPRFAYNVGSPEDLVLVVDADGDTPQLRDGLVARLRERAIRVHLVVLPTHRPLPAPLRGPGFGSYRSDDVAWLLTDLSAVALEAPVEEREEAIQAGGAHYAESLPIEYQPDAEYRALFEQALTAAAARLARAVGVVTELVLAERGPDPVLVSLARAGTPVGVLMRRWAALVHGRDLPHYAVSIVRGRGIDEVALRYLAAHHDPSQVVFVDGWTGKGAIARELAAAVEEINSVRGTAFPPELAVLADPGSCVATFGTRADFLIPSACLNSTVSGLVSRTVLNPRLRGAGDYHGAKFYREFAAADVSERFVETVAGCFAAVAEEVAREWPAVQAADRTPTWAGWRAVEELSERYGIGDVTLVKPGVGETTRVLLRRVPWAVLVRPDAGAELDHVRLLARQRGVPVEEVDGLAYSCVGLIHPRYTRGATGADGTAIR